MKELQQEARTVAIKDCSECNSGLLERDKFCRWCGARQPGENQSARNLEHKDQVASCSAPLCNTVALAAGRTDVYRRVSGPLVSAVVTGALNAQAAENQSAFIKRVILALISIPIWMIIVLLSPIDAYAAVRNVARQV